jgi:hypothetical protein
VSARRDTARRWVIDDQKSDAQIAHLIVIGYDEGRPRREMEGYVNEARKEQKWWADLDEAYRDSGYQPSLDFVAGKLAIAPKTLRKQCRDHGINDWRSLHSRFG